MALAKDGADHRPRTYRASGRRTTRTLALNLQRVGANAVPGDELQSLDEALASARALGADFLLYPEIAHWSDRWTILSDKPDRVYLFLRLIRVPSGEVLDARVIHAVGQRWVEPELPQWLLRGLVRSWVEVVFEPDPG